VPSFKAIRIDKADKGTSAALTQFDEAELMDGDVTVALEWSTLNYKDGLAITGKAPVVRRFPMIAGIDFAGTVQQSLHPAWKVGDKVVCTGWGMGETHLGGYAEKARVKGDWLVRLPQGLSARQAMAIGTAGFTAMLAVMALEKHGLAHDGKVVVSGASGGVGSMAVAILAHLGYKVVASTGKSELHGYLKELGAQEIVGRDALSPSPDKPLESGRWTGAVDTVGGEILAGLLPKMAQDAGVAACGNAGGNELHTTVLPFILRGVSLLGIDSNFCPRELRLDAWNRLARELPKDAIERMIQRISLQELPDVSKQILKGQLHGRVVVDVNA
jgi:acrylyl-CoA reductase (NADPH)